MASSNLLGLTEKTTIDDDDQLYLVDSEEAVVASKDKRLKGLRIWSYILGKIAAIRVVFFRPALVAPTELTIATGAITITQGSHTVDTESDAASDDLVTISGGTTGDQLTLTAAHADRTVVIKHGTGNILTWDGSDIPLDETRKAVRLHYDGTNWLVYSVLKSPTGVLLTDGSVAGTGRQELLRLNYTDATELTIATGAVTVTQSRHTIDTEADAASDALDTISGGQTGDRLTISAAHADRTVVVKHGTGNVQTWDGSDVTLDETRKVIDLEFDGTSWHVLGILKDPTGVLLADGSVAGTGRQELLRLNYTDATELTIATGAIAATQSRHTVDTEGDAASDDLDTISGGQTGDRLTISAAHADRTVVVKHGTGNVQTWDGSDVTLDETRKVIDLEFDGTNWNVIGQTASGAGGALLADGSVAGTGRQELLQLNLTDPTTLTVTSNTITPTQGYHKVNGSGGTIKTIAGGQTGDRLVLEHGSSTVTLEWGVDNIRTFDLQDFSMTHPGQAVELICDGTNWLVLGRIPTGLLKSNGTVAGTGRQELLLLNYTDATERTIFSGAISITQSRHTVDTEGDAASDDLDLITAGSKGDRVTLSAAHADRTVVVKHGTGNVQTWDGEDVTLDETRKVIDLEFDGTNWNVIGEGTTSGVRSYLTRQTLTDGASISYNIANPQAKVTLGGDRALANFTGLFDGATGSLLIVQDGTGGRSLTKPAEMTVSAASVNAFTDIAGMAAGEQALLRWEAISASATIGYLELL